MSKVRETRLFRILVPFILAAMLVIAALPMQVDASSFTQSSPKFRVNSCMTLYDGVQLSWTKVSGAKKYYVYRATSPNGKYRMILSTKKTRVKLSKKLSNGDYYYKVRAGKGRSRSKFSGKVRVFAQNAQIVGYKRNFSSNYTLFTVKVTNRTNKPMYFNNSYSSADSKNYSLYQVTTYSDEWLAGTPGNAKIVCSKGRAKVIPAKKSALIYIKYPCALAKTSLRDYYSYYLITASFYPGGKGPVMAIGCTSLPEESGGAARKY